MRQYEGSPDADWCGEPCTMRIDHDGPCGPPEDVGRAASPLRAVVCGVHPTFLDCGCSLIAPARVPTPKGSSHRPEGVGRSTAKDQP